MRFALYRLFPTLAALSGVCALAGGVFLPDAVPRFLPEALAAAAAALAMAYALAADEFLRRKEFCSRECARVASECERLIETNRALERRVEGLSIMREIHRTGNISSKAERIRRILEVINDIAGAEDSTLFRIDREHGQAVPMAYYNRLNGEELFMRFSSPVGGPMRCELRDVSELRLRNRIEFRAELANGKDKVGTAEVTIHLDERPTPAAPLGPRRPLAPRPEDIGVRGRAERPAGNALLAEVLARASVDDSFVAEVIQSKSPLKAEGERAVLVYPLIAENELIGALKVRLSRGGAESLRLTDIEQILEESASHIAIAMKKEEEAERSIRDGLTGLFNKRHFSHELKSHFDAARVSGRPLSLMMIDIDHFKRINDKFGHPTGDTILKSIASVLRKTIRTGDLAFRYGGEELSVVLPGATLESAAMTAERVRGSIEEATFLSEERKVVPVTVSVGVAEMRVEVRSGRALVEVADQALYRSKKRGRNRVSLWPQKRSRRANRPGRARKKKSA